MNIKSIMVNLFFLPLYLLKQIGNCDNPLFYGYENALRKVKQPNSTTTISVYDATKWLFDEFPYSYFVYPGAFIDIEDYGKQYFCANMVQPYYQKNPSISNRQVRASLGKVFPYVLLIFLREQKNIKSLLAFLEQLQ